MPIKKSALKAVRKDERKHLRNLRITSELRTLARKFELLLTQKQMDAATTQLKELITRIDQAQAKGILHANTASRKKSRLSRHLATSRA